MLWTFDFGAETVCLGINRPTLDRPKYLLTTDQFGLRLYNHTRCKLIYIQCPVSMLPSVSFP